MNLNRVIEAILFILWAIGYAALVAGCTPMRGPGTQDEDSQKKVAKDENLNLKVERPAGPIGEGPQLAPESQATIETRPDGTLLVNVPAGSHVEFNRGTKQRTEESRSTESYFERVYSAPWWMWAVGVGLILAGLVAAVWLGSIRLGVCAAGAGALVLSIGVALESYRWMFGLLAGGAILGLAIYAYYLWHTKRLSGALQLTTDQKEKLQATLKVIVQAVENVHEGARKVVTDAVHQAAKDAGIKNDVKDVVTDAKRY